VWTYSGASRDQLLVEPVTTAIDNAFVCGPSVLPALGQEGELLAAWAVAALIERASPRKNMLRRGFFGSLG
jgi:hypothetical protein